MSSDQQGRAVVVTTPNVEHNVRYETLPAGSMRHADHRFEWSRSEFGAWADRVASTYGYTTAYVPIGADDAEADDHQTGIYAKIKPHLRLLACRRPGPRRRGRSLCRRRRHTGIAGG